MEKINQTELLKQSTILTVFLDSDTYKGFTPLEKEIVIAVNNPLIKSFEDRDLTNCLIALITKIHLQSGQLITEEKKQILDLTVDELSSDFKKYNGNVSFREIEIAFKNGLKGEYGEYFGLNNKTYFQWVNGYTYGEKRLKVKKALSDAKEKANQPIVKKSEQEANEIMKNACLKSFEDFKSGAVIFDSGNVKYNFLVKMELLNFSKERKNEILARITNKIKSEAVENKNRTESISQTLGKILEETIISESKKECLKVYFKDLVDTGMELSELME